MPHLTSPALEQLLTLFADDLRLYVDADIPENVVRMHPLTRRRWIAAIEAAMNETESKRDRA